MIKTTTNTKGFTLMEILIAMALIGILSGVGVGAYVVSLQKSRDGQRKSDLASVAKALEAYQNDFGSYPGSSQGKLMGCSDGKSACEWGGAFSLSVGNVYMNRLPKDPSPKQSYAYEVSPEHQKYRLFSLLENTKDKAVIVSEESCGSGNCNYGISSANTDMTETW